MAKKTVTKEELKMVDHVVTQEDLDNNPALVEGGVAVGDTIQVPEEAPTKKSSKVERVVFKLRGGTTREFSNEVHGEAFEELASEFSKKHAHLVLDSFSA